MKGGGVGEGVCGICTWAGVTGGVGKQNAGWRGGPLSAASAVRVLVVTEAVAVVKNSEIKGLKTNYTSSFFLQTEGGGGGGGGGERSAVRILVFRDDVGGCTVVNVSEIIGLKTNYR